MREGEEKYVFFSYSHGLVTKIDYTLKWASNRPGNFMSYRQGECSYILSLLLVQLASLLLPLHIELADVKTKQKQKKA